MERFELSNRFWRLRDFQSRALDQLGDISIWSISFFAMYDLFQIYAELKPLDYYITNKTESQYFFQKNLKKF